jgi:hypothetical protein
LWNKLPAGEPGFNSSDADFAGEEGTDVSAQRGMAAAAAAAAGVTAAGRCGPTPCCRSPSTEDTAHAEDKLHAAERLAQKAADAAAANPAEQGQLQQLQRQQQQQQREEKGATRLRA